MKSLTLTAVSFGIALAGARDLRAQGHPAAKATARVAGIAPLLAGESGAEWRTILANTMKMSSQKDMFVTVAVECGLTTSTTVRSRTKQRDTSKAEAAVQVVVVVDPGTPRERIAEPGVINYCNRVQELSAVFQGIFEGPSACTYVDPSTGETVIDTACLDAHCLTVDPSTGAIVIDEQCLAPEEVSLILETMSANSFSFVLDDLGSGVHTIAVMARIHADESVMQGEAEARAFIGKGSMTVEEVRLIKGEDFLQ